MGHSIRAIVTKQSQALEGLIYRKVPQDFAVLVDNKQNRDALANQAYLAVWTDYFGGAGEQGSVLYSKSVTRLPPAAYSENTFDEINSGLKELGVIAENDKDEFDSVWLGRFRSNDEIDGSEED